MELHIIDWSIIVLMLILNIYIAYKYSDRAGKSITDYFLSGRQLPWYIAGISMVATTFAADTPLAVTELVNQQGIAGNWLWWNFAIGGLLTTFFFAHLWRRANIVTEVELVDIRYSGISAKFLRTFKVFYQGVFMNILIIGWVNLAFMSILQVFFDLSSLESLMYTGLVMLLVSIYTSMAGLWGVAINDTIQFFIAMTGCIILSVLVLHSEKIGGITGLKSKLPEEALNFFPKISSGKDVGYSLALGVGSFFAYVAVQWWASWYPGSEPGGGGYTAQRMMSAKNEKHAVGATLFFQVAHYCIRPWPWILVALCTVVLYPELGPDEKRLGFIMTIKDFMPIGLKGLMLAALFAAYMSTISTQLNWGASYIINDFYNVIKKGRINQKQMIMASRIVTFILMIISLFATNFMTSISGVWTFIVECGAGLGFILIMRWYWWRINAWSEIVAHIAPFIGYAIAKFILHIEFPQSFFFTVGFSVLSAIIATYITKPVTQEKLVSFYKLVRPEGFWQPVSNSAVIKVEQSSVKRRLVLWLSGVVLVYSTLFLIGKFILLEWETAIYYLIADVVAFVFIWIFYLSKNNRSIVS